MMHQQKAPSRFYVRMPRYIGNWLRTKYSPKSDQYTPIRLPWRACVAGSIVYQRAVSNASLEKLTSMCYSDQMFNMDPFDVPEERRDDFPSDSAMREFVAIALPEPHYYNGVWISDDETMQLTLEDTQLFNRYLALEFWRDLDEFWSDYQARHAITNPNRHCSFYDCMLDFMEFWGINLDNEEALYRAVKRRDERAKSAPTPRQSSTPRQR